MSTRELRHFLLVGIGAVFAFLLPNSVRGEGLPTASACRYVTTVGAPSWITTGVWHDGRLLVVDVVERKLVEISRAGVAREVDAAIGTYLDNFGPARIRAGALQPDPRAQFVVELEGGKLLNLDRHLSPRRRFELATIGLKSDGSDGKSGGNEIAHLIDWILAGDEVVGYADIQGPGKGRNSWKNGFVRFKLEQPESFKLIREELFPDDTRVSMTLTYPLMASIGRTAFVALVDTNDPMGLWRFGPNDEKLEPVEAFSPQLAGKSAPSLSSWVEKEEFPGVMAEVEQATMPAGLWSANGSLYLLSRTLENGQRRWFLSRIDPVQEKTLWTVRVPGSAHHMSVIPGPDEWAFLEKGRVTGWLSQDTHHIRFVKSSRLRSPALKSLCN